MQKRVRLISVTHFLRTRGSKDQARQQLPWSSMKCTLHQMKQTLTNKGSTADFSQLTSDIVKNVSLTNPHPMSAHPHESSPVENYFPQFHGISTSAFLSWRHFRTLSPHSMVLSPSYGTIFAAKWSSNSGLEAVISK